MDSLNSTAAARSYSMYAQVPSAAAPLPTPKNASEEGDELTEDQLREVRALQQRDAEVVRHEETHYRMAGPYAAGRPQYEYTRGPDDQRYRTNGYVDIDTSKPDDPEETIRKATVVKRAALAPAEPSDADRKVAAEADAMIAEARRELAQQQLEAVQRAGDEAEPEAARPSIDLLA